VPAKQQAHYAMCRVVQAVGAPGIKQEAKEVMAI